MPGIPLVTRETSSYTSSRSTDQMCREDGRVHLSAEEEIAAEESLSVYCKPVELYNILQRRAIRNPLFLQRCLRYKVQAKHKKRIQMSVSVSASPNQAVQRPNSPFPLYVWLARLVSDSGVAEFSSIYRYSRACVLTNFAGAEGNTQLHVNFVLPEMNKLAVEAKSGSLSILLVSFAGAQSSVCGIDLTKGHLENFGGCCLFGKIPLESLWALWEKSPNMSLGGRVDVTSTIDMNSCFLKLSCLNEDKCVLIQVPFNSETVNISQQVQVNISAEDFGSKEKSPYHSYTSSDVSSSSLSRIIRLRAGNVIFNYKYYNNKLQKTEVTEDFSCPFCLVKCASFKGLRCHLPSSHDLFNFEFWISEEFQAVNISVKIDDWRSEIIADGIDPKQQTFIFCSKKPRRRRPRILVQNAKHVESLILESNLHVRGCELFDKADGTSASSSQAYPDPECIQSVSGNNLAPPAMLQFAKTRKLSIERSDMRNRSLLHKRQFFHSHRAQPMAIEQVLSDQDSEDEVDDDVADFEDQRMLDDFVDVTKDEKQMMHMWNSFVRKQRVLADGHIPWACEAFSRLYGHNLVQVPALIWCWRLFMIKLWNHGLLDARTMNNCNIILEQYQKPEMDPMKN